jgi:hypothetical protein
MTTKLERLTLVVIAIALTLQSNSLRNSRRALHEQQFAQPGEILPRIEAVAPEGERVDIGDPPLRHNEVLIILSPYCEFCEMSVEAWRTIAEAARKVPYTTVVVVSTGNAVDTQEFLKRQLLEVPIRLLQDLRDISALRADVVPQTIVMRSGGRVAASHVGVLNRHTPAFDLIADASEAFLAELATKPPLDESRVHATPLPGGK